MGKMKILPISIRIGEWDLRVFSGVLLLVTVEMPSQDIKISMRVV
jgi:hypothetical protein